MLHLSAVKYTLFQSCQFITRTFMIHKEVFQQRNWKQKEYSLQHIGWKVSVFGVSLVRIFPHSDWMRRVTPYLSVFNPNAEKYRPEKLRIQTLFTQWCLSSKCRIVITVLRMWNSLLVRPSNEYHLPFSMYSIKSELENKGKFNYFKDVHAIDPSFVTIIKPLSNKIG